MDYKLKSFRHAKLILENHVEYKKDWYSLLDIITSITDKEIIDAHNSFSTKPKGLAKALNKVLKEHLSKKWEVESPIFTEDGYSNKSWRLDFAQNSLSLEVAFNHGEAIAWNLLKPVIASELNHVQKRIQTDIGIIICATKNLKTIGGFDGATGEFEKFERYLNPLRNMLTVPIIVIGLESPKTFHIVHSVVGNKKHGIVKMNCE